MASDWPQTLQELAAGLAQRAQQVAVTQLRRDDSKDWSYAELSGQASSLWARLSALGVGAGQRVVLIAPSSPRWMIACLALLEGGAVPVPVDSQAGGDDLTTILTSSGAHWAFVGPQQAARVQQSSAAQRIRLLPLDDQETAATGDGGLEKPLATPGDGQPARVDPEAEAVLFFTSGTSGQPKGVPLTHANLLSNLRAILDEGLITPKDRLLQPLPLHHVYPFALGMLAPLAAGIPIILPYSLTGPQLVRALNDGQATALLGIPRLYSALFSAIEQRIAAAGGPAAARLFSGLLRLSALISRHSSWRPGKLLFAPLRRRFAPRLRMLTSGGAALPADLAWRLDGLGWEVATGYGLTETSPILTVGPPEARRYDSAGRALPGVALRIAPAQGAARDGEVLAKGPNVFGGYLDLPEETASAFTDDGWYRTGDLGHLDEAGWLYLSGRASARIVLSGGENVDPEAVENRLTGSPAVREAAVLEHEGRLAALLVPTPEASRQYGSDGLEQQLRREVAEASREAPSHQQIGTIRLTQTPLPRTRLGKLRRHLLEGRFRASGTEAERPSATGLAPFESLAPGDRQLLEDPVAERVWSWLGGRFKQHWITPDTSLRLDLNVDSLEWVSLTMDLQGRLGIALEETAIARIETVRDLLQEAAAAGEAPASRADIEERLRDPEAQLDDDGRAWLAPADGIYRPLGTALHALSRWAMRIVFRLQIAGREHIPETGPCLLAPNHLSALDPVAIIACLDSARRRQTYWGGWTGILFHRPWTRLMSRALQVLPIDPQAAPISSLAFGAAVLARDKILVWFPEGARSTDGSIKPFRPGIGTLALLHSVPIVPVHISGTGKALPPGSWRLRPHAVTVRFGAPLDPERLEQEGAGETPAERLADALREHVRALAEAG